MGYTEILQSISKSNSWFENLDGESRTNILIPAKNESRNSLISYKVPVLKELPEHSGAWKAFDASTGDEIASGKTSDIQCSGHSEILTSQEKLVNQTVRSEIPDREEERTKFLSRQATFADAVDAYLGGDSIDPDKKKAAFEVLLTFTPAAILPCVITQSQEFVDWLNSDS